MEARVGHQKTKLYNSLYVFTSSLGIGLIVLLLFWLMYYRDGFSWQADPKKQFNWHPFMMVLSMVFLYSQAILIYRTGRYMSKKKLKLLHAGIHLLAFILSVIGLKAVFDSHNLATPPIPNLYSLHSWIGLLTVIIYTIQFLAGFISFLYPGLSSSMRKTMMPVHIVFGTITFIMGLISVMTGLTEKALFTLSNDYSRFIPEAFVFNFMGLITTFYGLLVLYLVTDLSYKRQTLPEEEIILIGRNNE
ncbi:putative transmembrane ascorbate-dependent reductase CYB561 homolog isoform X2 [Anthonomus grandis grandis]|nr:putative transmembrane ascorbate-dependent reductase CYB561 homolog isoform X2 [Anthonomus grandis grandis]